MRVTNPNCLPALARPAMFVKISLVLALFAVLSSCGGGGGGGDGVDSGGDNEVARIEISPAAVLLTSNNDSVALTAKAYNVADELIDEVPINWSSNKPGEVSVDSNGIITSQVSAGSAQITAAAQGIESLPLVVAVAMVVPTAILIHDDQVAAEPVPADPSAQMDIGYELMVRLFDDLGIPAIGNTIVGTGVYPIGGVVTALDPQGDGTTIVTYELVEFDQLFTELDFDEEFDLSKLPVEPWDPASIYTMEILANGDIQYNLKPGAPPPVQPAAVPQVFASAVGPLASWKGSLGPFSCEASVTPPITIKANPGTITIGRQLTVSARLRIPRDSLADFEYMRLTGEVDVRFKADVKVTSNLTSKVDCSFEGPAIGFPIPVGPLAALLGGRVQLGADFGIGGEISAPDIELGADAKAAASASVFLNCPASGSSCSAQGNFSKQQPSADFTVDVPDLSLLPTALIFKPEVSAFGTADAKAGLFCGAATDLGCLSIIKGKAGLKQTGEFSFVNNQIHDDNLAANYQLDFEWEIGPGSDVSKLLKFLRLEPSLLTKSGSEGVAKSPKSIKLEADKDFVFPGDMVQFTVDLDSASTNYTSLFGYNVDEIKIYRKNGTADYDFLVARAANPGQTKFTVQWQADKNGSIQNDGYFAFVKTSLIPIDNVGELELGTFSGSGSCDTTVTMDDLLWNHDLSFEGTVTTEDGSFPIQVGIDFGTQADLALAPANNSIYLPPISQRSGGGQAADISSLVYDLAAGTISITATYPDDSYFRDANNVIHKLTVNTLQFEGTFERVCITPVEGFDSVLTFSGTHNWGPAASATWTALGGYVP